MNFTLKKTHFIAFLERLETINIEKYSSSSNHGGRHILGILGPSTFNNVPRSLNIPCYKAQILINPWKMTKYSAILYPT